jgi:hypothetical protein
MSYDLEPNNYNQNLQHSHISGTVLGGGCGARGGEFMFFSFFFLLSSVKLRASTR